MSIIVGRNTVWLECDFPGCKCRSSNYHDPSEALDECEQLGWTKNTLNGKVFCCEHRNEGSADDPLDLAPCRCGQIPTFRSESKCYGHGEYGEEWFVSCTCGMRTKGFGQYTSTSIHSRREVAAKVWNNVMC